MRTFADANGRTWTLALTLGSALTVRDRLGIDLLQPEAGDPPLLTRLGTDELLLGETILALLEGQFEAGKLSPEEVRRAFDGGTLLRAQEAFYGELTDFFRSRGRSDRALAVGKQRELVAAAVRAAEARIEALDPETMVAYGEMSGESPADSDSTHAPSP